MMAQGDTMQQVEIRVEGHLDPVWEDWLDSFKVLHAEKKQTILLGEVKDQAALYGLIAKLRDLGLRLVSIKYGE
jgi:hypothetical protein